MYQAQKGAKGNKRQQNKISGKPLFYWVFRYFLTELRMGLEPTTY